MSTGHAMDWSIALEKARRIHALLRPVCEEVKAAGSLRRRRPTVTDLEFVIRPKSYTSDLLGGSSPDIDAIRRALRGAGDVLKDGDRYIQLVLAGDTKADIFMVHPPAEWGTILAIRTGPAELGKYAVMRMPRFGRYCRKGRIVLSRPGQIEEDIKDDQHLETWPTPTEEDFFRAAGLVCVEPALRDTDAAYQKLTEPEGGS